MNWLLIVLQFVEQNPAIITDVLGLFVKHPTLVPTIVSAAKASTAAGTTKP
jgi:hypothetical protein